MGYGLFEVVSFDEIGSLLEGSGNATTTDLQRFGRAVKLQAFLSFTSAVEALENANAISEHAMTSTLFHFLELHLPKTNKKKKAASTGSKTTAPYSLGVINPLWKAFRRRVIAPSCVDRMIPFGKSFVAVAHTLTPSSRACC